MKKNLLLAGALVIVGSVQAQDYVTHVGEEAQVHIKENCLVYNGGGMNVVSTGLVDNSGNVMVVGDASAKFTTTNDITTGGNFVLRMFDDAIEETDPALGLKYGQLYIEGLSQANITGTVDKQYKDTKNGTYQQMALPFFEKSLSTLSTEFAKTFGNTRWTRDEILVYNNQEVLADYIDVNGNVLKPTSYYMVGGNAIDPSATLYTVKGTPIANGITEDMAGAGANIDFGAGGNATNKYREKYNTYLQDSWAVSDNGDAWTANYGKDIYQYGNPFLTNIDLGLLGKQIPDLRGVRVESVGVVSDAQGATMATSAKYITYASGVATGDVDNAIIRPMQAFVVKLNPGGTGTINFDDLRRFRYTPRNEGDAYSVTTQSIGGGELKTLAKGSSAVKTLNKKSATSTVKQLGVIAQNAEGKEIGRTYYVVYDGAFTGSPKAASTQVSAGKNVIGTFEESPAGGIDNDLSSSYWLYINEANEADFLGKEVPMYTYSDEIKSLRFELRENAALIENGLAKSSAAESFYIKVGNDYKEIKQGETIPATTNAFGLFYGLPEKQSTIVEDVQKPSTTVLVYDDASEDYKLIFDEEWTKADVKVYDMAGRLLIAKENVDATKAYTIQLPAQLKSTYVVTAVSDKGVKFSQKVIK